MSVQGSLTSITNDIPHAKYHGSPLHNSAEAFGISPSKIKYTEGDILEGP